MTAVEIVNIYPELFEDENRRFSVKEYGLGVGPGWYGIVADLVKEIRQNDEASGRTSTLAQIKEKFGGLRFYLEETSKENFDAILKAERLSLETCETCGAPGKSYSDGWIKTLCREHARESWENRSKWKEDLTWERCWRHDNVNNSETPEGN
jgi:hypothetical protein